MLIFTHGLDRKYLLLLPQEYQSLTIMAYRHLETRERILLIVAKITLEIIYDTSIFSFSCLFFFQNKKASNLLYRWDTLGWETNFSEGKWRTLYQLSFLEAGRVGDLFFFSFSISSMFKQTTSKLTQLDQFR